MDSDIEFHAYFRCRPRDWGMRLSYANWLRQRDRPFECAGQEILAVIKQRPLTGFDLVQEARKRPRTGVDGGKMLRLLQDTGWASDGVLALRLDDLAKDEALGRLAATTDLAPAEQAPAMAGLLDSLSRRLAECVLPTNAVVRREYVPNLSQDEDHPAAVVDVHLAGFAQPGFAEARRLGTAYAARTGVDWSCVYYTPNHYLIGRKQGEPVALLALAKCAQQHAAPKRRSPKSVPVSPEGE